MNQIQNSVVIFRQSYHARLFEKVIRVRYRKDGSNYPNFADTSNTGSIAIAGHIVKLLNYEIGSGDLAGQTSGGEFETITKDFIQNVFDLFAHLRPGKCHYSTKLPISYFDQYQHLAALEKMAGENIELAAALGTDYIVKPDIVISRAPFTDIEINARENILDRNDNVAKLTPIREANSESERWFLHASISCKWTIRSDRAQNVRAEVLNLIRNRKGRLPHIVAVTGEPLPTRINSLALGTGDLDCVYHFALPELIGAVKEKGNQDQNEALDILLQGRRLRDISDLPFDLLL
jgi:hypothetical protein